MKFRLPEQELTRGLVAPVQNLPFVCEIIIKAVANLYHDMSKAYFLPTLIVDKYLSKAYHLPV
jgi:hypothetical protein